MSITFEQAKTYLKDTVFFDATDDKSTRMAGVVINRALDLINSEHDWSHYHKDFRINLYPVGTGYVAVDMGSNTFALDSAPIDTATIVGSQVQVGSADELYTIASVSGQFVTTIGSEPFRGASGETSGTYKIHYNMYEMPSGTRNISMMYDSNYFGDITFVSDDAMQSDVRRVGAYENQPFTHTTVRHSVSGTKAIRYWPSPGSSGTMQFYGYRHAEKPVSDSDVLDWDGEKDELMYAALDYVGSRLWFRGREGGPALISMARSEYENRVKKFKSQDIVQMVWDDDGDVDIGLRAFPTRGNG